MELSREELDVVRSALDILVRTEGGAMQQHGIQGLRGGRVDLLAARLVPAVSALGKIEVELTAIAAAEKARSEAQAAQEAEKPAGG